MIICGGAYRSHRQAAREQRVDSVAGAPTAETRSLILAVGVTIGLDAEPHALPRQHDATGAGLDLGAKAAIGDGRDSMRPVSPSAALAIGSVVCLERRHARRPIALIDSEDGLALCLRKFDHDLDSSRLSGLQPGGLIADHGHRADRWPWAAIPTGRRC